MPRERHGRVRRYPGTDQVPDAAASEVMNDAAFKAEGLAGGLPGLAEVTETAGSLYDLALGIRLGHLRAPRPMEDEGALEGTQLQPALADLCQLAYQGENAALAVLAVLGTEFTPGDVLRGLLDRGQELGDVARRDLGRYYRLLEDELRRVELSEDEADLMYEAVRSP